MAILALTEAEHFSRGYHASGGIAQGSFRQWADSLSLNHQFSEGTPRFDQFRDISLREVERLLFMSASLYGRSFDMHIASASSWAHVTLYYGSFFSAQAILGAFGTWKLKGNSVLDVVNGTPGSQRFMVRRLPSTYSGSHQRFWEFFYTNVQTLLPWIDAQLRFAITPISGDPAWQIDTRNDLNYDTFSAFQLISTFQNGFRSSRLRSTLPSVLNTQFQIMEALLQIASKFCRELRISTDALDLLQPRGNRRAKLSHLVISPRRPKTDRFIRKSIMR